MPYLIHGNAKDIFTAFGREMFVADVDIDLETATDVVVRDIHRAPVFGQSMERQLFERTWQDSSLSEHIRYLQGNMSAGNLFLLIGEQPFRRKEEDESSYSCAISKLNFGFVDDNGILSGLCLIYRKDKPGKWVLGLTKYANKCPEECQVSLLGSHPFPQLVSNSLDVPDGEKVNLLRNSLINSLNSKTLQIFLENLIIDGKVNPDCERIVFLNLRTKMDGVNEGDYDDLFEVANLRSVLFDDNPVLDRLIKLSLSAVILRACIDKKSSIYQSLSEAIENNLDDDSVQFILILHEAGVYEEKKILVEDESFVKKFVAAPGPCHPCLTDDNKLEFLKFLMNYPSYKVLLNHWSQMDFQITETLEVLYQLRDISSDEQQKKLPALLKLYFENTELTLEKLQWINNSAAMGLLLPRLKSLNSEKKATITENLINYLEHPDKTEDILKKINSITDKKIKQNTYLFVNILHQIHILQRLNCPDHVLALIANTSNKGARFRQIISRVQRDCIPMLEHLKQASEGEEKWLDYKAANKGFRKALYLAAYGVLEGVDNTEQFQTKLSDAQKIVEKAVHMDRHPQLRKAMMVLTNFISVVCTLCVANLVNKYNTGHFFFYTQAKSADTVERLGKDIETMAAPSA